MQRVLSRNTMVRVTFILLIAAVLVSTVTGCNAKVEQKHKTKQSCLAILIGTAL